MFQGAVRVPRPGRRQEASRGRHDRHDGADGLCTYMPRTQMFVYDGPLTPEALVAWALEGYGAHQGLPVPPPLGLLDPLLYLIQSSISSQVRGLRRCAPGERTRGRGLGRSWGRSAVGRAAPDSPAQPGGRVAGPDGADAV